MQIYVPLLLLIGFVALNAVGITLLSHLITRARPNPIKDQPYESGIPPLGDARERFSVKFYMVAMLFIVFDIETVFMLPWGVWFQRLSCRAPLLAGDVCQRGSISLFGFWEMVVFVFILLVGYIYVWKKGALQWD